MLSRFSRVLICVTLWTLAHQVPLSMGFSRQVYWSGLPFPPPRDLSNQGSNLCLLQLLHWQADSLPLSNLGSLINIPRKWLFYVPIIFMYINYLMCVHIPASPFFFFLTNQHYVFKEESDCHVVTQSASPIIVSHAFPDAWVTWGCTRRLTPAPWQHRLEGPYRRCLPCKQCCGWLWSS